MILDDGYAAGYCKSTNISIKNELFDSNDNRFDGSVRQSISPGRNITFQRNNTITNGIDEDNERPLLDELEIYPGVIAEKATALINPFASNQLAIEQFLADIDVSGPLFFCFLFGSCLFLAGKLLIFGHMYGLAIVSILGMYGLLRLMAYGQQEHFISIKGVASALGYGMLHLVWFSFFGIFMHLNTYNGVIFAAAAIILSTIGASRILCSMSNRANYGALVAYPTAMIYTLFAFLVVF